MVKPVLRFLADDHRRSAKRSTRGCAYSLKGPPLSPCRLHCSRDRADCGPRRQLVRVGSCLLVPRQVAILDARCAPQLPAAASWRRILSMHPREGQEVTQPSTIALDGPAGSGKTTVGELLARHLGYMLFDTGVMYRAAALMALRRGVSIDDEAAVTALSEQLVIDVLPPTVDDGRLYTVLVDGMDVTHEIRSREVDATVSPVSVYPGVRAALTAQQRRIGERGRVVMVGRDIGTVVLPNADLKIYLDAEPEERARRRLKDCQSRGDEVGFEHVLSGVLRRDEIDGGREHAPMRVADDAVVIDSTGLSVTQVVSKIKELLEQQHDNVRS